MQLIGTKTHVIWLNTRTDYSILYNEESMVIDEYGNVLADGWSLDEGLTFELNFDVRLISFGQLEKVCSTFRGLLIRNWKNFCRIEY